MQVLFTVLTVLFIFASLALVIIILVQRPQGGGLSAAFGGSGAGGSETAFGGRTGDALTVTTVTAFVIYLGLAMGLNIVDQQIVRSATAQPVVEGAPANGQAPAQPGAPVGMQPGTSGAPSGPLGLTQNPDGTFTLPGGGTLTPISGPPPGVAPGQPQPADGGAAQPGSAPGAQPPQGSSPAAAPPASTPPASTPPAPPAAPPASPPATP